MRLGVCYYPEHWPESMWKDDAARMKALGIDRVRIGEFAWSRIEPTPGEYDWDWLDRAIETLAGEGLKVVMCTPTATPPKWLIDLHPDILPVGADGRRAQLRLAASLRFFIAVVLRGVRENLYRGRRAVWPASRRRVLADR